MQRSVQWLLLAGFLALGCGQGEQTTEDKPADVNSTSAVTATTPTPVTNALVQVVIYGLGVLKLDDDQGKLTGLSAHFPEDVDHKMRFDQGVYDSGKYKWKTITDAQGHPIDIRGNTILVKMTGALGEERKVTTFGKYPKGADEAVDTGWILQAKEIDDPTSFDDAQASVAVTFETGHLETCALVFPPETAGTEDSVCAVKVFNDKGIDRGISEVMVVRGLVKKSASGSTTVEVKLDGMQTQTVQIPATGGNPVTWQGIPYDTVINIAIGNVYHEPKRVMETHHAEDVLKPLFSDASRSWYMKSLDCESDEKCSCVAQSQPACWSYFAEFFRNSPSGYDRPICPFVGWRQ